MLFGDHSESCQAWNTNDDSSTLCGGSTENTPRIERLNSITNGNLGEPIPTLQAIPSAAETSTSNGDHNCNIGHNLESSDGYNTDEKLDRLGRGVIQLLNGNRGMVQSRRSSVDSAATSVKHERMSSRRKRSRTSEDNIVFKSSEASNFPSDYPVKFNSENKDGSDSDSSQDEDLNEDCDSWTDDEGSVESDHFVLRRRR